ncbi:VOC family protein [Leptolyngbya sp. FACHB-36]|uniref:VOC family protein n=1 Tax=Leptolyngbya sp. FACHB-36 TaxID=2692808 RepID=UPI00168158EC|nr:VOC family protein [Leptolyngbya sp. FACHB-36]MBD2022035.1 VOC family protein [Leptolyngbya sp. FACHB-36]
MPLSPTAALLALASANFESLVQFYGQLLDQSPIVLIPSVYAEFQLPGLRLGIFCPKLPPTPHAAVPTPPVSLCLEVENLEEAIAQFAALGYPPPGEIMTASHGREIYAYDPDGNCIILHQSN